MFGNGMASFGRIGPTGQRGPPLEVDHFDRKDSMYFSPETSENFDIMESTPWVQRDPCVFPFLDLSSIPFKLSIG